MYFFHTEVYYIVSIYYIYRMDWLFGKRLTPEEMLRKNKRALDKAIRDLDRERFDFFISLHSIILEETI